MWPTVLLVLYSVLVILASLVGGWLPSLVRLTHTRSQLMISFVASLMLGVALLHLLPHAAVETGSIDTAVQWTLFGLLGTFFLMRAFHHHHHEPVEVSTIDTGAAPTVLALEPVPVHAHDCGHDHDHDHHHDHHHDSHAPSKIGGKFSWLGIAIGLSLHTLMDGIALAAGVEAESAGAAPYTLLGIGTFLAVFLHKPLDAMSVTSVMRLNGWSPAAIFRVNAGFALMCPLGAALFCLGTHFFAESQHVIVGYALGFSAGVFLCISLADLLPEVQFHAHDRIKLSAALLLGVALAWGIGFLEPEHRHSPAGHDDHHGHDHGHDHSGHGH